MNQINVIIFSNLRDLNGEDHFYEPISIIEHRGNVYSDGITRGHYTCDLKVKETEQWVRTNDNCFPQEIDSSSVTKHAYVILFERI